MTPTTPSDFLERRRERLLALRACTLRERRFLKQLPQSRYAPYKAGRDLGMNDRSTWMALKRPRVKRAMEVFLQDALDEIGVSHASLVADLVEIKERCMQARPVLDKDGKPTGEYQFDPRAAIAAIQEIAELVKIAPPKRIQVSGSLDVTVPAEATRAVADRLEEITDPNEAALLYQQLMYGKVMESPKSVN